MKTPIKKLSLMIAIVPLMVAGCGPTKTALSSRFDGRSIKQNPELMKQWEIDNIVCTGEEQKANLSAGFGEQSIAASVARAAARDQVYDGCMAQKGYRVKYN